jgi:hypothetical protein
MRPSVHTLVSHAFSTLPDSISKREQILRAVKALCPKPSEFRSRAKMMLVQIENLKRTERETQLELALITSINASSKTKSKKFKPNNQ